MLQFLSVIQIRIAILYHLLPAYLRFFWVKKTFSHFFPHLQDEFLRVQLRYKTIYSSLVNFIWIIHIFLQFPILYINCKIPFIYISICRITSKESWISWLFWRLGSSLGDLISVLWSEWTESKRTKILESFFSVSLVPFLSFSSLVSFSRIFTFST